MGFRVFGCVAFGHFSAYKLEVVRVAKLAERRLQIYKRENEVDVLFLVCMSSCLSSMYACLTRVKESP